MGKVVPSWQTWISCQSGSLVIRHQKQGLAEDLEIPWPDKLVHLTCEKVCFQAEELRPLAQYKNTLDTVSFQSCQLAPGALRVLAEVPSLRCLDLRSCGLTDEDLAWLKAMPKLELLDLSENPNCTGAVIAQLTGSPLLRSLYLTGTQVRDEDLPLLLSFSKLGVLSIGDTLVTDAALPQLAENRTLQLVCTHAREGLAAFRAAQRQRWKKKLPLDEAPVGEAAALVRAFYEASQDPRQRRSGFVTPRYLDHCKTHGYSGVDPEQRVSFSSDSTPPHRDVQVVDAEQITRKKFYIYSEKNDEWLTQFRCLVVLTEEGWKIDKNQWLFEGKWRFYPLK